MSIYFFIAIIAINLASICISTVSLIQSRKDVVRFAKACPKCGWAKPTFDKVGDNRDLYVARCPMCGFTPAKNGEARPTVRGAVKVWNKGEYHGDS